MYYPFKTKSQTQKSKLKREALPRRGSWCSGPWAPPRQGPPGVSLPWPLVGPTLALSSGGYPEAVVAADMG